MLGDLKDNGLIVVEIGADLM